MAGQRNRCEDPQHSRLYYSNVARLQGRISSIEVFTSPTQPQLRQFTSVLLLSRSLFFIRIFNHPNILPVLGVCNQPPSLVIISQLMPFGSLYNVLHGETGIVVDHNQALRFAVDIAKGMEFLHSMDPLIQNLHLNSKHVMVSHRCTLSFWYFS